MNPQDDSRLLSSARAFSRTASVGVVLLGSLVLVGWEFDITALKSVSPSLPTMKTNTALAFLLAGLSLWLQGKDGTDRRTFFLAHLCAAIVALIGLLTLSEYLFDWNLGTDTVLFTEPPSNKSLLFPGRMAPATALCFLLAGAALLLLDIETRQGYRPAQQLILTEGLISFLVLIGYAYEVQGLYMSVPYSSMALHTALAFIILCIGVLFARPDRGVMSFVVSENAGGALARRLLLPSISALVGLGWLRILGEDIGLYGSKFGVVVMVTGGGILFILVVWINARALDRLDAERKRAEEALRESEERYRSLIETAKDVIFTVSLDGTFTSLNSAFEVVTDWSRAEWIGQPFAPLIHPADLPLGMNLFQRLLQGETPPLSALRILLKSGASRVWEFTATPQFREGKVVGVLVIARDTTERKQVEETLRSNEARLRAIFENAAIGIGLSNMEGRLVRSNPALQEMVGYSEEELRGMVFTEFTHPEDRDRDWGLFRELMEDKREYYQREKRYIRKDGGLIWIRLTVSLSRGAEGAPQFAVGMVEDITERKQAEEALRNSEERHRLLFESNPLPAWVYDLETLSFLAINDAAVRRYGYAREEFLTMTIKDIRPADSVPSLLVTVAKLASGRESSGTWQHRRKDGTIIDVEISSHALTFAGRSARLVLANDITERKRAEMELERLRHQLELTLNSVADGIQVLDLQGQTTFVNPSAVRMIGYAVEELAGQPMHDMLHHSKSDGTPYPREECPISATLKDGALHHVTDEVFWRRDGTSFPVEYLSAPIHEGNAIVGAVVTFRDISERQAVERLKGEFVSVVSHELRTPLTSIRGALGLLTSGLIGSLPERGQRMLEIAVNNTDRLVRLINDILDIERMESGKVTMQRQVCDAAALMTQATDEMRGMAEKAGVTLSVYSPTARLWADPDRIVQTLTNLLSNAIKFSPQGTTVWLTIERQEDQVVFQVKDQGRGIPADKLESIFERFQQVDASDARKKGGTGLGLAICRNIVQQHEGRIWAESTLGAGSTFVFTLPFLQGKAHTVPAAFGSQLVLVCDDDPSTVEVMSAVLEQHGYGVVKTTSGQEAVAQAVAQQPAVILLDLLMPEMNGWETMAKLKEKSETRDIPIIICSVLSREEGNSPDLDAAHWVQKPLDESDLFRTLKRVLDERAQVTQVLVVEDDLDLANVLAAMLQRDGINTVHARTGWEAIQLCEHLIPDLLVLDLILPDGDGFMVVDWLRQQDRLRHVPLVVYSAKDLDDVEREQLRLGQTQFFTKGRISPEEFEQRVMGLLKQIIPAKENAQMEQ